MWMDGRVDPFVLAAVDGLEKEGGLAQGELEPEVVDGLRAGLDAP